jgi:hypothetical protein
MQVRSLPWILTENGKRTVDAEGTKRQYTA